MRRDDDADDDATAEFRESNDKDGAVDGMDDTDKVLDASGADAAACPGAPGESTESERLLIAAQIGDCGSDKEEAVEIKSVD